MRGLLTRRFALLIPVVCMLTVTLKQRYTAVIERFMRSGAAMRESERWSGDTDISGLTLDFEEELYFITDWIDKRIAFLDEGEFAPGIVTTIAYPFADKENAPCFNILGQPVSALSQSGLYIIKGQKFFVR